MFGEWYNSSMRRYIVMMGDLFSHIQIIRKISDQTKLQKVPITYGSKERFMMKLNKANSINSTQNIAKIETILPRLNLNLLDVVYNPTYKTAIQNRVVQTQKNSINTISQYNPVPMKFIFELGIYTRHMDDMFQIIEQIYPYFQPHFNTKIKELQGNEIEFERDIRVVLQSTTIDENIEGGVESRRHMEWSIIFEVNGWLYPPIADIKGEIRSIYLDFFANEKEIDSKGVFESVDLEVEPDGVSKEEWDKNPEYSINYGERNEPRT